MLSMGSRRIWLAQRFYVAMQLPAFEFLPQVNDLAFRAGTRSRNMQIKSN